MLLMLGARSAIFDKWSTPPGLLIVFALVLLYAIGCGWLLRRTAERARVIVLECLNDSLLKAKGEARQPAVAQLDMMIKEVETTRRGAFGSLLQQPLIQAALLPLSGASGIAVLEYFLLGR
jgi:hypothetical protein